MDIKIIDSNGKADIYTPYNAEFVRAVKNCGAKWNKANSCWTVEAGHIDTVREIMRRIWGRDDQDRGTCVTVQLTFARPAIGECEPVTCYGRTVARAFGRDSGAVAGDGVAFVIGAPESGGSVKNWKTVVPEGCIIRMTDVPLEMFTRGDLPEGVIAELIDGEDTKLAALREEREKLMARLAKINEILGITE